MTTEKMTIHQALCELKVLNSRIRKAYTSKRMCFAKKNCDKIISGVPVEELSDIILRNYQSATDLIKRRDAIKRAVALSNATTQVQIGDNTFTVAEAIEMKDHSIPIKRELLEQLLSDYQRCQREADMDNDSLEARANEYIRSLYGNADKQNNPEIKKTYQSFIEQQTKVVVCPFNMVAETERLSKEIEDFTINVDSALSVSNALTTIEVSY